MLLEGELLGLGSAAPISSGSKSHSPMRFANRRVEGRRTELPSSLQSGVGFGRTTHKSTGPDGNVAHSKEGDTVEAGEQEKAILRSIDDSLGLMSGGSTAAAIKAKVWKINCEIKYLQFLSWI